MKLQDDTSSLLCSVIVPVYNGSTTIEHCLNALAQQTVAADVYEIIVVDDGSTDDTAAKVTNWMRLHGEQRCRLLHQANQGPAAARNAGAQVALAPLFLFTDADCCPVNTWMAAFLQMFQKRPEVSAAMGAYASDQKAWAARFAQLEFEERYAYMQRQPLIDLVATYSAAYRSDIFLAANGFDPTFPKANNEDVEFSYRLSQQGYKMAFVPGAIVYHSHAPTWQGYAQTKMGRAYWRMIVYMRHPAKAVKDSYTPQVLKLQILLAPLCLLALLLALGTRSFYWLWLMTPFFATTIPSSFLALRKDPPVTLCVAWGLWLRSMAFALGVIQALTTTSKRDTHTQVQQDLLS